MELNDLQNAPGATKNRKRVGRGPGSGTGKTSGKGHKGQQSRSGYKRRPQFEGGQMPMHMRLPKRGFNHQKRFPLAIINVEMLDKNFEAGDQVTSALLLERHLVGKDAGGVKVLGKGEITKAIHVTVQAISPGAQSKIEAAGGSVTLLAADGKVASAAAPVAAAPAAAAAAPAPAAPEEAGENTAAAEE